MSEFIKETINKIIRLYEKWGAKDYIGERITQYQHALQSGIFAMEDNTLLTYDEYTRSCTIIGAFLHDIGHLIGIERKEQSMIDEEANLNGENLGVHNHEHIGAQYLKELGFPSLVCNLVENHVDAKRYLCSVSSEYLANLSEASRRTMNLQGGLMTQDEIKKFNMNKNSSLYILIRYYDDQAKKIDYFTENTFNQNLDKIIEIMKYIL
jgi:predicted HD phosphohydrolase